MAAVTRENVRRKRRLARLDERLAAASSPTRLLAAGANNLAAALAVLPDDQAMRLAHEVAMFLTQRAEEVLRRDR